MMSSIGYKQTLNDSGYGNMFTIDDYSGYPKELNSSKLFYIEISKEEIEGNKGLMDVSYSGINAKVNSKFTKKYPYKFYSFPNSYRMKDKNYFLELGYKYRLLVYSNWVSYYGSNGMPEWKHLFSIAIQDLSTDKIYGTDEWYWHNNYIDEFFKCLKKK